MKQCKEVCKMKLLIILILKWQNECEVESKYQIYTSLLEQDACTVTKMWLIVRISWQCSHRGEGSFFRMCEWVRCVISAPPVGLPLPGLAVHHL